MKKIISYLAESLNISERKTSEVLKATIAVIKQRLRLHEWVLINNVALFCVRKRPEEIVINSWSLKKVLIPPRFEIDFLQDIAFLDAEQDTIVRDLKTLVTIQADLDEKKAQLFVKSFIEIILKTLDEDSVCRIKDFGIIKKYTLPYQNLNTLKQDSHKYHFHFIADKKLRDEVNKPFSFFETVVVPVSELPIPPVRPIIKMEDIAIEEVGQEDSLQLIKTELDKDNLSEANDVFIDAENQNSIELEEANDVLLGTKEISSVEEEDFNLLNDVKNDLEESVIFSEEEEIKQSEYDIEETSFSKSEEELIENHQEKEDVTQYPDSEQVVEHAASLEDISAQEKEQDSIVPSDENLQKQEHLNLEVERVIDTGESVQATKKVEEEKIVKFNPVKKIAGLIEDFLETSIKKHSQTSSDDNDLDLEQEIVSEEQQVIPPFVDEVIQKQDDIITEEDLHISESDFSEVTEEKIEEEQDIVSERHIEDSNATLEQEEVSSSQGKNRQCDSIPSSIGAILQEAKLGVEKIISAETDEDLPDSELEALSMLYAAESLASSSFNESLSAQQENVGQESVSQDTSSIKEELIEENIAIENDEAQYQVTNDLPEIESDNIPQDDLSELTSEDSISEKTMPVSEESEVIELQGAADELSIKQQDSPEYNVSAEEDFTEKEETSDASDFIALVDEEDSEVSKVKIEDNNDISVDIEAIMDALRQDEEAQFLQFDKTNKENEQLTKDNSNLYAIDDAEIERDEDILDSVSSGNNDAESIDIPEVKEYKPVIMDEPDGNSSFFKKYAIKHYMLLIGAFLLIIIFLSYIVLSVINATQDDRDVIQIESNQSAAPDANKPEGSLDDMIDTIMENLDLLGTEAITDNVTLKSLAEKYYGNDVFWIYLYEANKDLIPNIHQIKAGTQIIIPSPEAYGFDIESDNAIEMARIKGERLLGEESAQ